MKPVDIDIVLNGCDYRKMVEFGTEDGKRERHYLYYDGEAVSGKVWCVSLDCCFWLPLTYCLVHILNMVQYPFRQGGIT